MTYLIATVDLGKFLHWLAQGWRFCADPDLGIVVAQPLLGRHGKYRCLMRKDAA